LEILLETVFISLISALWIAALGASYERAFGRGRPRNAVITGALYLASRILGRKRR
jgi:hypothetical protein